MKKTLFSLFTALSLIFSANAQDVFNFGITGGLNVSTLDLEGAKFNNGWFAGLTAKAVAPVAGLGVDGSVLYSSERIGNQAVDKDNKDVCYIIVPINLRYELKLPLASQICIPFISAGVQFDYSYDKDVVEVLLDDWGNIPANAEKYEVDQMSWHFNAGAGVVLASHIQLAYQYSIPISNSWKNVSGNGTDKSKDTDFRTHKVSLTYFF